MCQIICLLIQLRLGEFKARRNCQSVEGQQKKKGGGQNNSVYNNCFMVIFLQSQLDFKQLNVHFN